MPSTAMVGADRRDERVRHPLTGLAFFGHPYATPGITPNHAYAILGYDAKADLVVYGMGERPLVEIVRRLAAGQSVRDLRDVRGLTPTPYSTPRLRRSNCVMPIQGAQEPALRSRFAPLLWALTWERKL